MAPVLRLGSRGSTLALTQTHAVRDRLGGGGPAAREAWPAVGGGFRYECPSMTTTWAW